MTIRTLNQFSFSRFDDHDWLHININGDDYPGYRDEDGSLHIITQDENFCNFSAGDEQINRLQEFYDTLTENTPIITTVVYNNYGSIFLDWTGADDYLMNYLKELLLRMKDENIAHHDGMPDDYLEFCLSHWRTESLNLTESEYDYLVKDGMLPIAAAAELFCFDIQTLGYEFCDKDWEYVIQLAGKTVMERLKKQYER